MFTKVSFVRRTHGPHMSQLLRRASFPQIVRPLQMTGAGEGKLPHLNEGENLGQEHDVIYFMLLPLEILYNVLVV